MAMNGSVSMYTMKPLIGVDCNITADCGMYRMKSLHQNTDEILARIYDNPSAETDVDIIEKRQEILLKKIVDLKKLLEAILSLLRTPKIAQSSVKMVSPPDLSKLGITHDIVLNVNPLFPLYSLFGLKKIWNSFASINYSWHLHSSVRSLPEIAKTFQEKLSQAVVSDESPLNITVVWKNVGPDCELIISPVNSVPLLGEVNLLRFLNKMISLPILEPELQAIQDDRLDLCHSLNHSNSQKEIDNKLKELSDGLDKCQWMMGDDISVVDIAAWSTVKKMKKPNLNQKLSKWFTECDNYINLV